MAEGNFLGKLKTILMGQPTFYGWWMKAYKVQPFASLETTLKSQPAPELL